MYAFKRIAAVFIHTSFLDRTLCPSMKNNHIYAPQAVPSVQTLSDASQSVILASVNVLLGLDVRV